MGNKKLNLKQYFENLYTHSKKDFNKLVEQKIVSEEKMFIITANPETFMLAEKNKILSQALLDSQTYVVADGIGIVKGAKILKYKIQETIPGVELCTEIFKYCDKHNKSIFLFGSQNDVLNKLVDVINTNYPNILVSGYENGYVENKQGIFDKLANTQPDVVLVALGIPLQETLIYDNLPNFKKGIFVGVGGSFDVLSGTKKRAPKLFINLHLEWLYRILREPKRLKRFFSSNIRYLFKIIKERIYP